MDISLESGAKGKSAQIIPGQPGPAQPENWDEVRFKIECYLAAWRFPREMSGDLLPQILRSAQGRISTEPGACPTQIAMEEADKFIKSRWREMWGEEAPGSEQKLALLCAGLPDTWQTEGPLAASLSSARREAAERMRLARQPQRPLENYPMTMRTSLSRLPSFRLIAGWGSLVLLLVLTFIFTR